MELFAGHGYRYPAPSGEAKVHDELPASISGKDFIVPAVLLAMMSVPLHMARSADTSGLFDTIHLRIPGEVARHSDLISLGVPR